MPDQFGGILVDEEVPQTTDRWGGIAVSEPPSSVAPTQLELSPETFDHPIRITPDDQLERAARDFYATPSHLRAGPSGGNQNEPTLRLGDLLIKDPGVAKTPVEEGVNESWRNTLNGLTTPNNLALMLTSMGVASTGTMAARLVSGLWAGIMGKEAVQNAPQLATELGTELGKPENERDYKKIGSTASQLLINTGFTVAPAIHAVRPGEILPGKIQAEGRGDVAQTIADKFEASRTEEPTSPTLLEIKAEQVKPVAPRTAEALKAVAQTVEQPKIETTTEKGPSDVQIKIPDEEVLRQPQPEVGLPQVSPRDAEPEIVARAQEPQPSPEQNAPQGEVNAPQSPQLETAPTEPEPAVEGTAPPATGQIPEAAKSVEAEPATGAAPARLETEPSRTSRQERPWDIIDEIEAGLGGKISLSKARELVGDFTPIGAARKLFAKEGFGPDDAAKVASKFKELSDEDLLTAINQAAEARKGFSKSGDAEARAQAEFEAQHKAFSRANLPAAAKEQVVSASLNVGDEFELQGTKVTVKELNFDENGEVTGLVLEDGRNFGTQQIGSDRVLNIDKGTLQQKEVSTEFVPAEESALVGMGGAVPSEFGKPGDFVSNMFAAIDADRKAMGKPPMEPTVRRSWDEDNQHALARMNREPDWIPTLLAEVKEKPRPLMSWENAGVVWHRQKLKAEYNNALQRIAQAFDDGRTEDLTAAKADAQIYENAIQSLDETVGRSGTGSEAGRSLVAQKMAAGDDFSIIELRLRKREANNGAPLTDAQAAEVQKTFDQHQAKIKELETHLADTQKRLVDEEIKRVLAESKAAPSYEPRVLEYAEKFASYMDKQGAAALNRLKERLSRASAGVDPTILVDVSIYGAAKLTRGLTEFAKWSDTMIKDIGDWVKPHLQEAWDASQKVFEEKLSKVASAKPEIADKVKRAVKKQDSAEKIAVAKESIETKALKGKLNEIFPEVQKLVRALVEQNPKIEREALIDEVHAVLKAYIPEITRLQTMDAISGRGRFTIPRQDEISKTVRDLKTQTRLIGHQIDVEARRPLPRTGYQPGKLSDIARREEQKLNELKRKFGVVVTDPAKQLASVLSARKTYYRNRMADLSHEIKTRERTVKSKTPSPTDPQLEQMKAEYAKLKEEHAAIFQKPGLTDAQRLEIAAKAADRQIAELERQLKSGEVFPAGKKPKLTNPTLEAKRAEIEALKAERDWARDLIQPKEQPVDVETRKRSASLDKQIAKIEKQIADEQVFPKTKEPRQETPENAARLAQLEELKKERDWIRDRLQPKSDPIDLALKARKAQMTRRIAELADRMARGDYAPKQRPKLDISGDSRAMELKGELEQIRKEFERGLAMDKARRRSLPAKIYAAAKEVLNLPKAIWSSFDISAVGRQGGFIGAGHPLRASKSLGPMFKALASAKTAFGIEQEILHRPNAQKYADSKLYLASLDEFRLSRQEEIMMSRYANAIPGVRMSNRTFMTYLNKLRADSFDAMVKRGESWGFKPLEQKELNAIANYINIATGRGDLGKLAGLAEGLATVFWSPRLVASRFQLLAGQPLYRGSARTRALIAAEYAQSLTGLGVLIGLGALAGATLELDPRSADFLKLKFGKTRVDILGGLLQNTVLLSRFVSGQTKTVKGKAMPSKSSDLAANFLRSKLTPALGMTLDTRDLLTGQKPPPGHPQTLESLAGRSVVPLAWQDIYDIMKDQGVPAATALEILNLLGMGVQHYDDKKK